MTLDEYLTQFVEGYLLEDLHSMASITLAPGKQHGAVGYPMVMTALSGIEVLGVLTARTKFSPDNGAARFRDFWRQYVYADRPAFQRLDALVYEMVRHGLAHSYLAKPMIRVTKHKDPNHLCRVNDSVLVLDALTLADDFEKAYADGLRPKIEGEFKANMEQRFQEFREAYWQDHVDWKAAFDKAPQGVEYTLIRLNQATRENRPEIIYSTNVSTTGFDSPKVNSPSLPTPYRHSTSDFNDPKK
jgi:hypothetical protein